MLRSIRPADPLLGDERPLGRELEYWAMDELRPYIIRIDVEDEVRAALIIWVRERENGERRNAMLKSIAKPECSAILLNFST
jgi:hypothetical protein